VIRMVVGCRLDGLSAPASDGLGIRRSSTSGSLIPMAAHHGRGCADPDSAEASHRVSTRNSTSSSSEWMSLSAAAASSISGFDAGRQRPGPRGG